MWWFIRRVVTISIILVLSCTGVMVIARLNREPGRLEALGFGVCDGEPCFRGIRPGMVWAEARAHYPKENQFEDEYALSVDTVQNSMYISITSSDDKQYVKAIDGRGSNYQGLPFNTGDIIMHYGIPCRLNVGNGGAVPRTVLLVYPSLLINVAVHSERRRDSVDSRLQINSSAIFFTVRKASPYGSCKARNDEASGPWRGFTFEGIYIVRNRHDAGATRGG
jgi:hypothetical protein